MRTSLAVRSEQPSVAISVIPFFIFVKNLWILSILVCLSLPVIHIVKIWLLKKKHLSNKRKSAAFYDSDFKHAWCLRNSFFLKCILIFFSQPNLPFFGGATERENKCWCDAQLSDKLTKVQLPGNLFDAASTLSSLSVLSWIVGTIKFCI